MEEQQAPQFDRLAFTENNDKELEKETEKAMRTIIASIKGYEVEYQQQWIMDANAIATIMNALQAMHDLYNRYQDKNELEEVDLYIKEIEDATYLPTAATRKKLRELHTKFVNIMANRHNFKDKVDKKNPWDQEVKKKFEIPEITPELEAKYGVNDIEGYYSKIRAKWKKFCFLISMYLVVREGDAPGLLAGPNNSGKTSTALPLLQTTNKYLREFWHVSPWQSEYLKKHPEKINDKLPRFRIDDDHVFCSPEPDDLIKSKEGRQFECIDINEGMEVATNLQSMRAEVIRVGVRRFTSRVKHNMIIYEYQVAKRPTAMMVEGMNFWIQKMGTKWFVLSMASSLYRKSDPYYFAEIDKLRNDRQISRWMTKTNPNFIAKFRAPKLKPKFKAQFDALYQRAQDKRDKASDTKRQLGIVWYEKIREFYDQVEQNILTRFEIPKVLMEEYGYTEPQMKKFMKDYDRYESLQKLSKPKSQVKEN